MYFYMLDASHVSVSWSGGGDNFSTGCDLSDGNWHYLALTFDGAPSKPTSTVALPRSHRVGELPELDKPRPHGTAGRSVATASKARPPSTKSPCTRRPSRPGDIITHYVASVARLLARRPDLGEQSDRQPVLPSAR